MMQSLREPAQTRLIETLSTKLADRIGTEAVDTIETHISWVLLAGEEVFKIKKSVDLGFLDFSTLERRKHYCEEELRLNGRLAPDLYLDVVAVTGTVEQPQLDGQGPAIEYAVHMHRFPRDALMTHVLERGEFCAHHVDAMVARIAAFHEDIPAADTDSPYGDPERVREPVVENFVQIRERIDDPEHRRRFDHLEQWSEHEYRRRYGALKSRKVQGRIRECHGDLHLGNMAWVDERLLIFDGIEFNPALYWIDVMSEVAFLCMDLEDHDRPALAYRFLNGYLARTGDYEGLSVFRYYQAYRAMVRAKVASIRLEQDGSSTAGADTREVENYLTLAERYGSPAPPRLLITHGLSASGKSTWSGPLAEQIQAIHIRSDRERQRLFGRGNEGGIEQGAYGAEATERTYARLRAIARIALDGGYSVVVDATFLKEQQRTPFRALAETMDVDFAILDFQAPADELRRRIRARQEAGSDISEADLAVSEHQLEHYEDFTEGERGSVIAIDTTRLDTVEGLVRRLQRGESG